MYKFDYKNWRHWVAIVSSGILAAIPFVLAIDELPSMAQNILSGVGSVVGVVCANLGVTWFKQSK